MTFPASRRTELAGALPERSGPQHARRQTLPARLCHKRRVAYHRLVGKLNTRVLWFFVKGRRIIAVHGIHTKRQTIPARDLGTARERMRDWKESNEL